MLQAGGGSAHPTVDGAADREASLTRLAPEGASSNSVSSFCICLVLAFCFTDGVGYGYFYQKLFYPLSLLPVHCISFTVFLFKNSFADSKFKKKLCNKADSAEYMTVAHRVKRKCKWQSVKFLCRRHTKLVLFLVEGRCNAVTVSVYSFQFSI